MTEKDVKEKYNNLVKEIKENYYAREKENVRKIVVAILDEVKKRIQQGYEPEVTIEFHKVLESYLDFGVNEKGIFWYKKLDPEMEKYFRELLNEYFAFTPIDTEHGVLRLKINE